MMDKDITDPSFKYAPSQNPIDPLKTSGSAALPNTMAQQVDFVPSGDDFADTIEKQTRQRIADRRLGEVQHLARSRQTALRINGVENSIEIEIDAVRALHHSDQCTGITKIDSTYCARIPTMRRCVQG